MGLTRICAVLLSAVMLAFANATEFSMELHPNYKMEIAGYGTNIIMEDGVRTLDLESAAYMSTEIYRASLFAGIPYTFMMAVVWAESRYNPAPKHSYAGARGPGQIMPATFKSVAKRNGLDYTGKDIDNVSRNLTVCALYLATMYKKFGTIELAAVAYNGGPGMVPKYVRLKATGDASVRVPRQTLEYARQVVVKYNEYNALIGSFED